MEITVIMPFIIIYDMKLECDFSYTCFEATDSLDPYSFRWRKTFIVSDYINRVSWNTVSVNLSDISLVYSEICRMNLKWKGIKWNM